MVMSSFKRINLCFRALLRRAGSGVLIVLVSAPFVAAAEKSDHRGLIFPNRIKNQIQAILKAPKQVYRMDLTKNKAANERIDAYFSRFLNFQKAQTVTRKKGAVETYRLPLAESSPIRWDGKQKPPERVKRKGSVWYTKQPQKRSFLKEMDSPTQKKLDDEKAIAIARAFITENKFATTTGTDKLMSAGVLIRKKQEIRPDGKIGKRLILSQKVTFVRQIDGLPVLNSKQIVDFHPDSQEIIGYKKIRWAETFSKGDHLPYRSKDEIVAEIRALLSRPGANYTIQQVIAAMYQTSDRIIPILAVMTTKRLKDEQIQPIQEVFLISLVKGYDPGHPQRPADRRRPSQATKR